MRAATWNLQGGGTSRAARAAQETVLQDLAADVLVLTEPGASYMNGPGVVTSPRRHADQKDDAPWVAIVGTCVEPVPLDIPFARMAVAATARVDDVPFLIYGSVLPWAFVGRNAPELLRKGETATDAFRRVLREQAADIERLGRRHRDHVIIWAGDFNQTVSGRNFGGSVTKREALLAALDGLGLVAWNAAAANADEGMYAIDLICGPGERTTRRQGRIDPTLDGVVMSDHAGYWVEL
jgi:hypothetical protein